MNKTLSVVLCAGLWALGGCSSVPSKIDWQQTVSVDQLLSTWQSQPDFLQSMKGRTLRVKGQAGELRWGSYRDSVDLVSATNPNNKLVCWFDESALVRDKFPKGAVIFLTGQVAFKDSTGVEGLILKDCTLDLSEPPGKVEQNEAGKK
jgi:hypothetical protein